MTGKGLSPASSGMANDTPDPQHTAMICRQIEFLFLIKDWLQMTVYQSYEVQVSAALSAVIEREADDPTEAISGIAPRFHGQR